MKIWIVLIVAGVLTFLMRYLPMNSPFFHRMKIFKHEAFAILPLCLLAALVGPTFLSWQSNPNDISIPLFVGGLITVWICEKSKSTVIGAILGYLCFIGLNQLIQKM